MLYCFKCYTSLDVNNFLKCVCCDSKFNHSRFACSECISNASGISKEKIENKVMDFYKKNELEFVCNGTKSNGYKCDTSLERKCYNCDEHKICYPICRCLITDGIESLTDRLQPMSIIDEDIIEKPYMKIEKSIDIFEEEEEENMLENYILSKNPKMEGTLYIKFLSQGRASDLKAILDNLT